MFDDSFIDYETSERVEAGNVSETFEFAIIAADGTYPPKETDSPEPSEPQVPSEPSVPPNTPDPGEPTDPPATTDPGTDPGETHPGTDPGAIDPEVKRAVEDLKRLSGNQNKTKQDYERILEIDATQQTWDDAQRSSFAAQCSGNGIDFAGLVGEANAFVARQTTVLAIAIAVPVGLIAIGAVSFLAFRLAKREGGRGAKRAKAK